MVGTLFVETLEGWINLALIVDPLRKSGGPKCCDAQHGFFNNVVGCDPRLEGST
jgi:hypothetical protein